MLKDRFGIEPSTAAGVPVYDRRQIDGALERLLGREVDGRKWRRRD